MIAPLIRVAVVGGGLGGTILTNALIKYPQLDVHLYEANSEFTERGASIGLSRNAQRALGLLGMSDIIKNAKGVPVASFRLAVGEGPDANQKIYDIDAGLTTVHRAALLRELLAPIPKDRLHLGKRLASISDSTLYFQDGTSADADLVIGSDGIHSNVRKYILGEDHPAIKPIFAGFWDCRTILPLEQARDKLGPDRINKDHPRQHMYVGNKSMILHDIIDDGETVCVIAGGPTPPEWDKTQWKQSVSRGWLNETFKNWGELGTDFLDLICGDNQEMSTFVQWASAETPTLHNGKNICMIGDAAHATTPWQGSGLALSIEDSLILQSVLGLCNKSSDIPFALEAYDKIMRPRGQAIIKSSHGTGLICVGANGLDAKKLAEDLPPRWDFIHHWDTKGAVDEAVRTFETLRSSSSSLAS